MSGSGYDAVVDVDDEVRCSKEVIHSYTLILPCWQNACFVLAHLAHLS